MSYLSVTIKDSKGNKFSKFWNPKAKKLDAIRWTLQNEDVPHYLDVDNITEIIVGEGDEV